MHWLILRNDSQLENFEDLEMFGFFQNSDIVMASFDQNNNVRLLDVYKLLSKNNFTTTLVHFGSVSTVPYENLFHLHPKAAKRRNFENKFIRTAIAIAYPTVYTGIDDVKMRHIETYARGHWPLVMNMMQALNFRLNMWQIDNYGWDMGNGTFSGIMGLLQRREVEFGITASFMRPERITLIDRTAETLPFKSRIFFRQPPLPTVTNIFILPFSRGVWLCVLAFIGLSILAIAAQKAVTKKSLLLEGTTTVLGALCQQGHESSMNQGIENISARIVFWTVFLSSLFLFTSHSAFIVALLQSPSHAIKTIDDITKSPLQFGSQNMVYNKVYFKEYGATSESIRRLYQKKVAPQKDEDWFLDVYIGMERVQHKLYAFEVETHAAYKYIGEHFYEYEKCQIDRVELFRLPPVTIPILKNSAFREIFTLK